MRTMLNSPGDLKACSMVNSAMWGSCGAFLGDAFDGKI